MTTGPRAIGNNEIGREPSILPPCQGGEQNGAGFLVAGLQLSMFPVIVSKCSKRHHLTSERHYLRSRRPAGTSPTETQSTRGLLASILYSYRSARTGFSKAARNAGMMLNTTAMVTAPIFTSTTVHVWMSVGMESK